jgi:hypothetical protein
MKMETALRGLTDEQLLQPGVIGEWSVKDILSHLTAWEAEVVTRLAKLQAGKKIQTIIPAGSDIDGLNAKWYQEHQDRDLDRVLADFHGVREQMIRQVESLTDKQLTLPLPWSKTDTIENLIAWNSYDHEPEHAEQIQKWRKDL